MDRLRRCDFSNRRWYAERNGERIGYVSERRGGFCAQVGASTFRVIWNDAREDGLWPSLNQAHAALVKALEGERDA